MHPEGGAIIVTLNRYKHAMSHKYNHNIKYTFLYLLLHIQCNRNNPNIRLNHNSETQWRNDKRKRII